MIQNLYIYVVDIVTETIQNLCFVEYEDGTTARVVRRLPYNTRLTPEAKLRKTIEEQLKA